MICTFPDSIACETCDTQYMLGDRLLVAPVMHADGHVDYYLPAGRWISLLTDEAVEGDTWRRETHGYLSLPLMVRPNTVLPMGAVDNRPDYDYTNNLELHVFAPEDGELAVRVPDLQGNLAATYTLTVKDGEVIASTDTDKPFKVIVHR